MPPPSTVLRNQAVNTSRMSTQKSKVSKLIEDGFGQIKLGQFDKAKQFFLNALKVQPNNSYCLGITGAILLRLKNYSEANEYLLQAIKVDPNNAEAHCNLGIVLRELKQLEYSLESYDRAIKLKPDYAQAYNNRGNVLLDLKLLDLALASFEKAIQINPNYAEAYNNRGNILRTLNNYEEAVICFEAAIKINPNYAEALSNLGNILQDLHKLDQAFESYKKAIDIDPNYAHAHSNCGNILNKLEQYDDAIRSFDRAIDINPYYAGAYNNRGVAFHELKNFSEAILSFEKAIEINPLFVEAHNNLGGALIALGKFKQAITCYNKALEINPEHSEAHMNKAIALQGLKDFDQALISYEKAINIDPNYLSAYKNLGVVLQELGLFEMALAAYDRGIEIDPSDAKTRSYKGMLMLSLGQLTKNSWLDYEFRWNTKEMKNSYIKTEKPQIKSIEPYSEEKILIWNEQGIGDQIFYSSVLPEVVGRMPNSIISIDERLIPIYKRSFPKLNFVSGNKDCSELDFEVHIPLGNCMKYFRDSLEQVALNAGPYIKSNNIEVSDIRSKIKQGNNLICGITWQSNNATLKESKSISLFDLLPVLEIPGITFINLQYGDVSSEILQLKNSKGIEIIEYPLIDNYHDLEGHVDLIGACDFLVGVSNSSAHIAGSLGKEMHLLYPKGKGSLWYWANQFNGKNIWYPTISIYQQVDFSNWDKPIQMVRDHLLNGSQVRLRP